MSNEVFYYSFMSVNHSEAWRQIPRFHTLRSETCFGMLYDFDLALFHAVNAWCGNWALDRIVFYEQGNQLLEGGVLLTCYWWFWFAVPEDRRRDNRRQIIAALIGVFAALVVSRVLAAALPFRMRPMYVTGIGYHAPSLPMPMNMENWSSFPSDTAAYFLGLAYGIYRLSRRAGIALMIYATVWILAAVVLSWASTTSSDIVAGAIIGFVVVGASVAMLGRDTLAAGNRLLQPVIRIEKRRPRVFYAAAFVVSFEMTMTFDDVRDFIARCCMAFAWRAMPPWERKRSCCRLLEFHCLRRGGTGSQAGDPPPPAHRPAAPSTPYWAAGVYGHCDAKARQRRAALGPHVTDSVLSTSRDTRPGLSTRRTSMLRVTTANGPLRRKDRRVAQVLVRGW